MLTVQLDEHCEDLLIPPPLSPSKQICPSCCNVIGKEPFVCTRENLMLHSRCFVCSMCKRSLSVDSYGVDLNGKFYCKKHMNSARHSEKDYKTLACGWLFKQGAFVKTWRRRYFVLLVDSLELRYYKSKDTTQPQKKGVIDLASVVTIQPAYLYVPADKNHPDYPNGSLPALQLITPCRIWNLACDTDSVREYWADAIRTAQATCGAASAAASVGVGRAARTQGSHGCQSSLPSPSPPPYQGFEFMSPRAPRSSPQTSPTKASLPIPSAAMSPPGPFTQESDVETNSPEDDSSSTHETRSRTGSGLGRGDGSACASQSIASATTSNGCGEGVNTRRIVVQPIVVPSSAIVSSCGGTPTTANGNGVFMIPGSPSKKNQSNVSSASGIGSPLPWQPSTPRGLTSSGHSGGADSSSGWGDSSSSSSRESAFNMMNESRLRAVSAGASLQPQMGRFAYPQPKPTTNIVSIPRPIIAQNRIVSPGKDSLLCSPHNRQIPTAVTPTRIIPDIPEVPDGEYGLSSFVFISTVN